MGQFPVIGNKGEYISLNCKQVRLANSNKVKMFACQYETNLIAT